MIVECGDGAWERAKYYNGGEKDKPKYGAPCVVYPSTAQPNDYDWSLVISREVAIFHNGPGLDSIDFSELESLATHLIKNGATKVIIADSEQGISPTYKPRNAA